MKKRVECDQRKTIEEDLYLRRKDKVAVITGGSRVNAAAPVLSRPI